jgi:hypothetical protein
VREVLGKEVGFQAFLFFPHGVIVIPPEGVKIQEEQLWPYLATRTFFFLSRSVQVSPREFTFYPRCIVGAYHPNMHLEMFSLGEATWLMVLDDESSSRIDPLLYLPTLRKVAADYNCVESVVIPPIFSK